MIAYKELIIKADENFAVAENTMFNAPKKLQELGFNRAKVEGSPELNSRELELIQKYRLKYPTYKFITKSQVKTFCKKYNLVYGETSLYKGTIPKKNLKEITEFKVLPEDRNIENFTWGRWETCNRFFQDFKKKHQEALINKRTIRISLGFCCGKGDYRFEDFHENFSIIAPQKDFKTSTKIKNFKIKSKVKPDDPVVLFKIIKNIFIIVTAWDKEALTPEIFDERKN